MARADNLGMKLNVIFTTITCIALVSCDGGASRPATDKPTASGAQESLSSTEFDFIDATDEINMLGVIKMLVQQPAAPSYGVSSIYTSAVATFAQLDTPLSSKAMELIASAEGARKKIGCKYLEDNVSWEVLHPSDTYPQRTQAKNELKQLSVEYPLREYRESHISAGSSLTLSTSDGSIVPMSQSTYDSGYYRENLVDNWYGWPRPGSVINIPGETFPAVNAAVISTVEPLMDLTSNAVDSYVTAGTTATWTVAQNPQSSIITFVAMGDGKLVCHAPDTGTFTFPEEVRKAGWIDDIVVQRSSFSYERIDDAMLLFIATVDTLLPTH